MTDARGFPDAILGAVLDALSPLITAAQEEAALLQLIDDLGWTLPEQVVDPTTLTAIQTIVSSLKEAIVALQEYRSSSQVDLAALASLTEDIIDLFAALEALNRQPIPTTLPEPLSAASFWSAMSNDLAAFLVARYFQRAKPILFAFLRLIGVLDVVLPSPGLNRIADHAVDTVHWDRLAKVVKDPAELMADVYGWGDTFKFEAFLKNLEEGLAAMGLLAFQANPGQERIERHYGTGANLSAGLALLRVPLYVGDNTWPYVEVGIDVFPIPDSSNVTTPVGLLISPYGSTDLPAQLELSDTLTISFRGTVDGSGATGALLRPGEVEIFLEDTAISGNLGMEIAYRPDAPRTLIGSTSGTGISVTSASLGLELVVSGTSAKEALVQLRFSQLTVRVDFGDGDSFVASLARGLKTSVQVNGAIIWSSKRGLHIEGQSALQLTIPLNLPLGPLEFLSLTAGITLRQKAPEILAALTGTFKLGPIKGSIDRIGVILLLRPDPSGPFFGLSPSFGFKPPTGAGLAIDASAVVGGGYLFFDQDKGQYGGILQLEVKGGIAIKAIGLITTRMPDGSPGFSFLIIITVEFSPIQLGYGFTLNGVGGLAGFNRTMRLDALRDGVKNRTLDSIMFPPDPIANAPKIISDLQTVFPVAPGRFVFAPMAKLGWGQSILLIEIGLAVELPAPLRLAIMGKLHLLLPPIKSGGNAEENKTLVEMHLAVLGTLDIDRREASVDAVLYNSRISLFPVSGGMALRLRWGSNPLLVQAIGGLNPRFTPPPGFPVVDRLAFQLDVAREGLKARLRLESYLGMTPNTLQFGARIDAYAEVSVATVSGYLGFDALMEPYPLRVVVDIFGGVTVRAFKLSFSVDMFLTLSGPRPWQGDGHVTIDFFGKREFPIHFTIDETRPIPPLIRIDPLKELTTALEDLRNWSATLPEGGSMLVTFRQLGPDEMQGKVLVHPLGQLTVRQTVLPLGIPLERFGAGLPTAPGPFQISRFHLGSAAIQPQPAAVVKDAFARGQFVNLTEDQKLSAPAFEAFPCGQTRIGTGAIKYGPEQKASFEYDVTIIDNKEDRQKRTSKEPADNITTFSLPAADFLRAAQYGAAQQTPMNAMGSARFAGPEQKIKVQEPVYRVAGTDDLKVRGAKEFDTYTEAEIARRSGPAGEWQVVEAYEVA